MRRYRAWHYTTLRWCYLIALPDILHFGVWRGTFGERPQAVTVLLTVTFWYAASGRPCMMQLLDVT